MHGDPMLSIGDDRISLDRIERGSTLDFISHAHSDHIAAARRSKNVFASQQTIDMLNANGISPMQVNAGKNIVMLPAGHMLGSRQLFAYDEQNGLSYLYSGDFQMQKSLASESIAVKHADILIIDSTYPEPGVSFGNKEEVMGSIEDWTIRALRTGSVLFSAYATGKAQEIIAIMNNIGIVPVVTSKINTISSVYRKHGLWLKYASAYNSDYDYEELLKGDFVGISEQRSITQLGAMLGHVHNRKFYTAMVTGFASFMHFSTDAQFSLSDHADFAQSIEYINEVSPKQVLTFGSNAKIFANNLNKFEVQAVPYDSRNNSMMER